MCKARETLRCPFCKSRLEVTRPDSSHPICSLEKPTEAGVESNVITQVYTCKGSGCNAEIPVYWYEQKMFLERK